MKVKFHDPTMPDDVEVDVGGFCLVNNKTVEIPKELIDMYEQRNGETLDDFLSRNQFTSVGNKPTFVPVDQPEESEVKDDKADEGGDD